MVSRGSTRCIPAYTLDYSPKVNCNKSHLVSVKPGLVCQIFKSGRIRQKTLI